MLNPGEAVRGFTVRSVTELTPPNGCAIELVHARSGARVLHLFNEDPENLFSITFPTPPPDDCGLPHILEHAVLGGSRRFPVRDPFFELVRMSLATFINAMTGLDHTLYPAASNVKQDLFNLADVYFDAVFHPLLTENIFKREGHHLVPLPDGGLTVSGIVYNEMKGAYSHPESLLNTHALRLLFPDSIYGRKAGGDPRAIPDLTFDRFRAFHQDLYHPSNARFVLYGNIPTVEYLDFLADRLAPFEARDIRPAIGRQPRWREPRVGEETYAIGGGESPTGRTYALLAWLAGDGTDPRDTAALHLLSFLLFGHEAAPLKKAIVDSGLGEDVTSPGAYRLGLEVVFRAGLKGTEPDRAMRFEALVFDTLRALADRPFDADDIEAAFHQAGYEYQEILPYHPLNTLDRVIEGWIYGDDPLVFLRMRDTLRGLRAEVDDDPAFFNRLIRERLLDNPHRLRFTLRPDPEHQARLDAEFAERMDRTRAGLDDEALRRLADEAARLDREAGAPNPPEALASLPQLGLRDLPDAPVEIPTRLITTDDGPVVLVNEVPANGISYLHIDVDLAGLPADLWVFLPRYTEALAKMGADGLDYQQIARRRAACLGAFDAWTCLESRADDPAAPVTRMRIQIKTLDDRIGGALELLESLLFGVDPRDRARLRDVLIQTRARERTQKVHGGTAIALLHAGRGFSPQGWLREETSGLPQLYSVERLAGGFDRQAEDLVTRIEAIRDFLLNRRRWTLSFTGGERSLEAVLAALRAWTGRLRDEPVPPPSVDYPAFDRPMREGLAAPIQVAHIARVRPGPHLSAPEEPLVALAAHLANFDYILPEIRFKGNAYGAGCSLDPLLGTLTLMSFRDPHVVRTFEVFEGVADHVLHAPWGRAELDRAVIGKAREDLHPIRPGYATGLALSRHIMGLTPEQRAERYRRRLRAAPDEVRRAMLDALEAGRPREAVCVLAARDKLEDANRRLASPLALSDVLQPDPSGVGL